MVADEPAPGEPALSRNVRTSWLAVLVLLGAGCGLGDDDDGAAGGGNIFRDPVGDEPIRARIERIGSDSREFEGVVRVGRSHHREEDVDGEEAWLVDATFDSAPTGEAPFTTRTIGFEHDGSDDVVSFNAPAASFDRHAEQLDELLDSWEFV